MTPPTSGRTAHSTRRLPGAPAPVAASHARLAGAPPEPGTARIAVDLLGGDEAPAVVVDGALRALGADPDLCLLLVGPPDEARRVLAALGPDERARVTTHAGHAGGPPTDGSALGRVAGSVGTAVAAVLAGAADAVVSAGPTGATVTAAALGFGRWPGVRRPALAATLPAHVGPVTLLDVGGSMEARPATLAQHAVLGAAYAAALHRVPRPRVGLLSVGTEAGKGDRARRAADPLLAGQPLPSGARYVGLVEGYDLATGDRADVVVTDGFTGNVLLKGIEGAYALAGGSPERGGAPRAATLLGVAGVAVVCHGAARDDDLASGIALAAHLHRRRTIAAVSALLAELTAVPASPTPR